MNIAKQFLLKPLVLLTVCGTSLNYFEFITIIIVFETLSFFFSFLRKEDPNNDLSQMSTSTQTECVETNNGPNKRLQGPLRRMNGLSLHTFWIVSVSTICYVIYMPLANLISTANLQQMSLPNSQSLQMDISRPPDQEQRYLSQVSLSALSSTIGQPFTPLNLAVNSIAISNDSNIAFLAIGDYREGTGSLQILNISDVESPATLSSLSFTLPISPSRFPGGSEYESTDSSDTDLPDIILSYDEQKIYLPAAQEIQIIDVSNLESPTQIGLFLSPHNIFSIALLSDDETMLLIRMTASGALAFEAFNTTETVVSNKSNATTIKKFSDQDLEIQLTDQFIFVGHRYQWHIYNLTNYTQLLGVLDLNKNSEDKFCTHTAYYAPYNVYISANSDYAYVVFEDCMDIFNITNLTAPTLFPKGTFYPNSSSEVSLLTTSSDGRYLYLNLANMLQVLDVSDIGSPVDIGQINTPFPLSMTISPNGQKALVASYGQLFTVQLYLGIESNQIFDLQNSTIATIRGFKKISIQSAALITENNTLYINTGNGSLNVFDVSNPASPKELSIFNLTEESDSWDYPNFVSFTPDWKTLLSVTGDINSPILFLTDTETGNLLSEFYGYIVSDSDPDNSDPYADNAFTGVENDISALEVSSDGNIAFMGNKVIRTAATSSFDTILSNRLLVVNISNTSEPAMIANVSIPEKTFREMSITLSQDGETLYLSASKLFIYDVSNLSNPIILSTFSQYLPQYSILSPDGNTLYLLAYDKSTTASYLQVLNVSTPNTSLDLIASLVIPSNKTEIYSYYDLMDISPNGQTLFVLTGGLTVIDITVPSSPIIIDYYDSPAPNSLIMSSDYSTAYLIDPSKVFIINLKPEYVFYIPSSSFLLGQSSSNTLNVLSRNIYNTYDADLVNYKFVSLSLSTVQYQLGYTSPLKTYSILPDWIDFDLEHGVLNIAPNSNAQVGNYHLYGAISKQISNMAFNGTNNITNSSQAASLVNTLISLGYLDNEGFLTSQFNPQQSLVAGSELLPDEASIRQVMAKYYIEAVTSFYVGSSLALSTGNSFSPSSSAKLTLTTLSLNPLNVKIILANDTLKGQFVQRDYSLVPAYENSQSSISMVGSATDINTVLSQLTIFLNGTKYCDGNITISDGLNPPLNQYLHNISAYFEISSKPSVDANYFQSQIDKVSVVTGDQFIIQFDYSTFVDPDGEDLTYTLTTPTGVPPPAWMTLRGLDLIGTPPDQLTGNDIPLKIVASNQYQSTEVTFTLHVGISAWYALKLVSSYGGGLITLLGIIFYAPKVYNIICKSWYRYPKEFYMTSGEEITPKSIYQVAFIAEPIKESNLILRHLDAKISKEIQSNLKSRIAEHFTVPGTCQIDKEKLIQAIREIAAEILNNDQDKKELALYYDEGPNSRKELIEKLIGYEMTIRLLDLKEEIQTKRAFHAMKKNLFNLVVLESCSQEDGTCEFSVIKSKILRELQALNFQNVPAKNKKSDQPLLNDSVDTLSFLEQNREVNNPTVATSFSTTPAFGYSPESHFFINIELLVAAMKAYAFKQHHLNKRSIDVKIEAYEKLDYVSPPRIIRKFLKRDLQAIEFTGKGQKIGYGIMFETRRGFLRFYGTTDSDIRNKVIVVQIRSKREQILREIWINGVNIKPEEEDIQDVNLMQTESQL